jgi:hypothetical protein
VLYIEKNNNNTDNTGIANRWNLSSVQWIGDHAFVVLLGDFLDGVRKEDKDKVNPNDVP